MMFDFIVNADALGAVPKTSTVKSIPLDRVMVETDSPFLSPEPERGKGNEPSRIVHTVSKLSEIYGISYEEIAKHTYDNTTELFRLP